MTREEAIVHIKDIICENNSIKPNLVVFEQEKEALYMAIKALERESVLDKIRAKIEEERDAYGKWSETEHWYAYDECLDIIDRYMEGAKE